MENTAGYSVCLVETRFQEDEFIQIPKHLYRDEPEFVAALDIDIQAVFDPKKNNNFQHGNACRFILKNMGKSIGRIAAFYKDESGERSGGIGFFDCPDDNQAAKMLFDASANWLKQHGCSFMDGPINFGERDKFWGLLISGFKSPSYQENYNFPYYQKLFEHYGFTTLFDQQTSEISRETFHYDRFKKLSERVFQNPIYRFEHYRKQDLKRYASDFIYIYNKAWAWRPDFVAMTQEKVETTLQSIKPILLEKANWFVYANNEPVGFYINVLDVNQIFKHLNGRMDLWGKIQFLWYQATTRINRIRGIVFGIIPEYQNLGLETGLIMRVYHEMTSYYPHFQSAELAWVGDFNPKMQKLYEALGSKTSKIHRTYRFHFT